MKKAEIKKTLRRAREMSRQHPGIFYRVMDRPGGAPVITGSDWVYRERVLMGGARWRCSAAEYGQEVR